MRGWVEQASSLGPSPPPSVFPLKDPDRRRQSETHIGTALTTRRLASGG